MIPTTFAAAAERAAGVAACVLGWRPAEFWGATPAELVVALGGGGQVVGPLGGDELAKLRERFPDG